MLSIKIINTNKKNNYCLKRKVEISTLPIEIVIKNLTNGTWLHFLLRQSKKNTIY